MKVKEFKKKRFAPRKKQTVFILMIKENTF